MQEKKVTVDQVVIQDLSNQISSLSTDRSFWRARALLAEQKLAELEDAEDEAPGDDVNTEVDED